MNVGVARGAVDGFGRRLSRTAARAWVRSGRRRAARHHATPVADHVLYGPFRSLVDELAPGRSFADMGCMWRLDGGVAFYAEEKGATRVTAVDAAPRSARFDAEHERRNSQVRFVRADLHLAKSTTLDVDHPDVVGTGLDAVGLHDVVWCTGVLYHTPNPFLLFRNLLSITAHTLLVGTKSIPEIPGVPNAAVFFPGLDPTQRDAYAPLWGAGIGPPFDRDPMREYANWWWGLSASALRGFVEACPGWRVRETIDLPYHDYDDNCLLVVEATR